MAQMEMRSLQRSVELIPSAHRLVGSLRDIGYDFATAIADLVDNSVEADATEVRIDFHFDGENSSVRIADNGRGMSKEQLDEALRYGSKRTYAESDLGKFGLGLKTASLSQCRKLTVASRRKTDAVPAALQWDLDHVEATDRWEATRLLPEEIDQTLCSSLQYSFGTVVLWEKLDRVLRYKDPSGKSAKDAFIGLCREVEEHLSMVFHRFLSNESRRRLPLAIFINGNRLEPWDPFARSEPATKVLTPQRLKFQHENIMIGVLVQPYILPNDMSFSSPAAKNKAAGPKKWNRQQGFYIYRNDRLIQSGGWNRIRAADEHTKLARIAIDFSPEADEAFQVNIAKMRVQLPAVIRNDLAAIAQSVAAMANAEYRRKPISNTYGLGRTPVQRKGSGTASNVQQAAQIPYGSLSPGAPLSPAKAKISTTSYEVYEPRSVIHKENQAHSMPVSTVGLVSVVASVLYRELASEPDILDRVLRALAEAHPEFRALRRVGEVRDQ